MADNADILAILIPQLDRDESCRLHAYQDQGGVWTVGWGCVGADIGPDTVWTQDRADDERDGRTLAVLADLDVHLGAWWRSLNAARCAVLANMDYNMGTPRFLRFKHMLAACQDGDWTETAVEMIDSDWARQLHYDPDHPLASRPGRLAQQMRTGIPV